MSDSTLTLKLKKQYDSFNLDIDTQLQLKDVIALFGSSGSGKTSLMRLIMGLDSPDKGIISFTGSDGLKTIWFDEANAINIPPYQRHVGYMFQEDRLFPHLNALKNLEYATHRNTPASDLLSLDYVIESLELSSLLDRKIVNLSGGEKQRLSLARTLLTAPQLLLLDEPLSGLDRTRKLEVIPFLEQLPHRFKIPIIYVSHDIEEVSRLTKTTMVLSNGRNVKIGATKLVLQELTSEELGYDTHDEVSLLNGKIIKIDLEYMVATISSEDCHFTFPATDTLQLGQDITLLIRAKNVGLSLSKPNDISIRNIVEGVVEKITDFPETPYSQVNINIGNTVLKSQITRIARMELSLFVGKPIFALIKSASFGTQLL